MTTITTRQQIWKDINGDTKEKDAELAGTYEMPHSIPTRAVGGEKAVIKTAALQDADEIELRRAFGALESSTEESTEQFGKTAGLQPHIDVSGLSLEPRVVEKVAQHYALPTEGMYPLDDYGQVEKAAEYFEEHCRSFPPELRREYCVNMVKRAHALGIPVSETAENYASESYGSPAHIKVALDMRRTAILDEAHLSVLDKLAEVAHVVEPERFAETLAQFDKMACIEHLYDVEVMDPFLSTFSKVAAKNQVSTADEDLTIVESNEHTSLRMITELAQRKQQIVADRFGEDFAKAFAKEPKVILDSLPRDEKLVLMRMANSSVGSHRNAST